jgi:hypothetical protein
MEQIVSVKINTKRIDGVALIRGGMGYSPVNLRAQL